MKYIGKFLVFVTFCIGATVSQGDFQQAQCIRLDENGIPIITEYDVCTSFCCGGEVVDNATNLECCGSIGFGSPFNPRFQHCCEWWTGHGQGQVRRFPGEQIQCCGSHRIEYGIQQCCQGHPDPPEVFQLGRQLCCNAHSLGIPADVNPMFATCCGQDAVYDRRFDSCPCMDGQILRNVSASRAECCESPDGLRTPYMPRTEICCAGQIGLVEDNFCCGELDIVTIGEEVCCSGILTPFMPPNRNFTACCVDEPYDPTTQICCGNQVMEIIEGADQCCGGIPYSDTKSICCANNLLSLSSSGTECCGPAAFFPGKGSFCCFDMVFLETEVNGDSCCGQGEDLQFYFDNQGEFVCCNGSLSFRESNDDCCQTTPYRTDISVCCDGVVFDRVIGDSCCQGQAYFGSERTICCDDGPFGPFSTPRCCNGRVGYDVEGGMVCCGDGVFGPFTWPACCVNVGYDAFTHTCCGAVVLENPNESNAGQCCGNVAIDRNTQLCCEGENATIPAGTPRARAECCNFEVFNNDTHLCCAGVIQERTNRFTTKCCGTDSFNTTQQLCCEEMDGSQPTLHEFEFGMGTTACCGPVLFNTTEQFCCDGSLDENVFTNSDCCAGRIYNRDESICCEETLLPIGNVLPGRAECCGSVCIYRGVQRCCNGRVYQSNVRSNATCIDF